MFYRIFVCIALFAMFFQYCRSLQQNYDRDDNQVQRRRLYFVDSSVNIRDPRPTMRRQLKEYEEQLLELETADEIIRLLKVQHSITGDNSNGSGGDDVGGDLSEGHGDDDVNGDLSEGAGDDVSGDLSEGSCSGSKKGKSKGKGCDKSSKSGKGSSKSKAGSKGKGSSKKGASKKGGSKGKGDF